MLLQLPTLKAAYAHYSQGREHGLSLAQWVRQLVDCDLAFRVKPAAPPQPVAVPQLDAPKLSQRGMLGMMGARKRSSSSLAGADAAASVAGMPAQPVSLSLADSAAPPPPL